MLQTLTCELLLPLSYSHFFNVPSPPPSLFFFYPVNSFPTYFLLLFLRRRLPAVYVWETEGSKFLHKKRIKEGTKTHFPRPFSVQCTKNAISDLSGAICFSSKWRKREGAWGKEKTSQDGLFLLLSNLQERQPRNNPPPPQRDTKKLLLGVRGDLLFFLFFPQKEKEEQKKRDIKSGGRDHKISRLCGYEQFKVRFDSNWRGERGRRGRKETLFSPFLPLLLPPPPLLPHKLHEEKIKDLFIAT